MGMKYFCLACPGISLPLSGPHAEDRVLDIGSDTSPRRGNGEWLLEQGSSFGK